MPDNKKTNGQLFDETQLPTASGNYWTAWAASITCGGLIVMVFDDLVDHTVLYGWYTVLVALITVRLIVGVHYLKPSAPSRNRRWRNLYLVLVTMVGITWGAGNILLFIDDEPTYQLFLLAISMGIVSVSVALHTSVAFLLFTQPVIIPIAVKLLIHGTFINYTLTALTVIYNIVLILTALNFSRIDKSLRLAKQEAEKANNAKSEFLANISHEIRTPLNAIIGTGHLLKMTPHTPAQETYLKTLMASSTSLLALVNNILDLSRIEAGKQVRSCSAFNLHNILQDVQSIFIVEARNKGLQLEISSRIAKDTCLYGDRLLVNQILSNLVANAIKFTQSGRITITADAISNHPGTLQISLKVSDSGDGISPEQQQRIFDSFSQADNSHTRHHGGAGLGLTISKHLAEGIGGQLTLESTPGKGSTFTFSAEFQLAESTAVASASPANLEIDDTELADIDILLVEDDPINQQIAIGLLEAAGGNVDVADNAPTALSILARHQPDIVLMDIQMPGMDGYEATRKIHDIPGMSKLPVIAMSAHAFTDAHKKAEAAGMNDFVTKPIDPRQLIATIRKWVRPGTVKAEKRPSITPPISAATETRQTLQAVTDSLGQQVSRKLFASTADTLPRRLEELSTDLLNEEWESAARHAHQLKGLMFIFGNSRIKALLEQIENIPEHDMNTIEALHDLRQEMNRALVLIHEKCC
jgi:signal transduction histidine kinase/DNA-binding response OmpR family regulator